MTEVISVKFKGMGREYYFDPAGNKVKYGDKVIVETQCGKELVTVSKTNHLVEDDKIVQPFSKMVRYATEKDIEKVEQNKKKEPEALKICEEIIAKHKLDMKLVNAEFSFDGGRIVFFFTADGRIDFRELVKDLAAKFHARIELRQIGVRDEAKKLGGIGVCGQPYCCKQFLNDFQSVSIKMAKEQGLSLNPTKVSGSCGRLMCCLKYEEESYSYLNSITPNIGSVVKTDNGLAVVVDSNVISGRLLVKPADEEDALCYIVHRDDVKFVSKKKS